MSINTESLPNKRLYHTLYVLSFSLMIAAGVVAILLVIWMYNASFSSYPSDYDEPLEGSNFFVAYYPDTSTFLGWDTNGSSFVRRAEWIFHWQYFLVPVVMFIAGALLRSYPGNTFRYYYRQVPSGKIVYMDTEGGGNYSLRYYVVLEGKTLAGEHRRETHWVNAKTFQVMNVGDHMSFS